VAAGVALAVSYLQAALPSRREKAMAEACASGDVAAIERLVERGAPLDKVDYWGMRPMEWAASWRQPAAVAALARLGAAVNVTHGASPLQLAIGAAHPPTVRALLHAGADPTYVGPQGGNALDHALDYHKNQHFSAEFRKRQKEIAAILRPAIREWRRRHGGQRQAPPRRNRRNPAPRSAAPGRGPDRGSN